MKKICILSVAVIFVTITLTSCAVRIKGPTPVARVAARPIAPSARHIWVNDEYVRRRGKYVLVPGYWATPRGNYRVYHPGHWQKSRRGQIWISGRWG